MAVKTKKSTESRRHLHEVIRIALASGPMTLKGIPHNVPYVVGTPGGGKTQMFDSFCKELRYGFISRTPGLEPVEYNSGIPSIIKTVYDHAEEFMTKWSIPELIVKAREMAAEVDADGNKKYEIICILFDDWHLCKPEIQAIGFELFTHRALKGHKLPDNAFIVLAGNETSAAGAKVQMSAIRNRCSIMKTESCVEYWLENYCRKKCPPIAAGFFSSPTSHQFFHEEESMVHQVGSPRSWAAAFNTLDYSIKNKLVNPNSMAEVDYLMESHVGEKGTRAFIQYFEFYSKIDVDRIFNKCDIRVPQYEYEKFAYYSAISHEYVNRYIKYSDPSKYAGKKQADYTKSKNKNIFDLNETLLQIMLKIQDQDSTEKLVLILKQIFDYNFKEAEIPIDVTGQQLMKDVLFRSKLDDTEQEVKLEAARHNLFTKLVGSTAELSELSR